ncbi:hypothetical protein ACQKLP_10765 [Chitinophaga sp. NPDC101104]|uniref:hypothetical protein n=1 Tax=Chitinophaga sp. NPDC101104 TaxID=3390561 RepID=UPI003CFDE72C
MKFSSIVLPLALGCAILALEHCKKAADPASLAPADQHLTLPPTYILQNLDQRLQAVIQSFQSNPESCVRLSEITRRSGTPYWSKALISQQGNMIQCLVPLKKGPDSLFRSFAAIRLDSSLHINSYHKNLLPRYRRLHSSPGAVQVNHALNALNSFGFGTSTYDLTGLDRLEMTAVRSLASTKAPTNRTQVLGGVLITTCYSWSTCQGDGMGNCVGETYYFEECVTDYKSFPDDPNISSAGDQGYEGSGTNYPPAGIGLATRSSAAMPPPKVTVTNLAAYLSCFNTAFPAKIIVYADQPTAGTTEPVSILGGIGHTWITIEQQLPGGELIRRSFGFYPQQKVNPFGNKAATASIGNDELRGFDVSWSATLTPDKLERMLQAVKAHPETYNLASYNCVNFVIDVAAAGGITLPRNRTSWIVGSGLNPGTFGEDLRQLPSSNGKKGTTLPNFGNCL